MVPRTDCNLNRERERERDGGSPADRFQLHSIVFLQALPKRSIKNTNGIPPRLVVACVYVYAVEDLAILI